MVRSIYAKVLTSANSCYCSPIAIGWSTDLRTKQIRREVTRKLTAPTSKRDTLKTTRDYLSADRNTSKFRTGKLGRYNSDYRNNVAYSLSTSFIVVLYGNYL